MSKCQDQEGVPGHCENGSLDHATICYMLGHFFEGKEQAKELESSITITHT